ncbi:MAG: hypothetical protein KAS81_05225, partial [Anaerolineales bacterium]|nr:hypothetical protein [Anaerolineales bacterium]
MQIPPNPSPSSLPPGERLFFATPASFTCAAAELQRRRPLVCFPTLSNLLVDTCGLIATIVIIQVLQ